MHRCYFLCAVLLRCRQILEMVSTFNQRFYIHYHYSHQSSAIASVHWRAASLCYTIQLSTEASSMEDGHVRNLCLCHHHHTFASLIFFCKMAFAPLFTLVFPLEINHYEQDDDVLSSHRTALTYTSSTLRQWCTGVYRN